MISDLNKTVMPIFLTYTLKQKQMSEYKKSKEGYSRIKRDLEQGKRTQHAQLSNSSRHRLSTKL